MYDDFLNKKIYSYPAIVENYDFLQKNGVLNIIEELKLEINNLNEVLKEAVEIFNKNSISDLVSYITKMMLDKFVPSYLAFIIQEEFNPDKAYILCYNNLQPIDSIIDIESIKPYKKFFSLSPAAVEFNAFKHMIEDEALIKPLLPLNPELLVPLLGMEGLYGFIVFGTKVVGDKYTEQELAYIDRIMKFSSVSLQNYIHYKRAIYDNKTKLYTYDYFFKRVEEEIEKVKRYNTKVALLMFDIDFFKKVNDTYGHLVGDLVLEKLAFAIKGMLRAVDLVARYGGEEFVVLLTECSDCKAFDVAERIREEISRIEFEAFNTIFKITVSIGVSCCSKENFVDAKTLIKSADKALYESKNSGRNRTTFCSKNV